MTRHLLLDAAGRCALVDGAPVAIAYTTALTSGYADIGVHTLPAWRRQGLCQAAASLVAAAVLESGRTPVWSTGANNTASQGVARKLGFRQVSRLTCVNTREIK